MSRSRAAFLDRDGVINELMYFEEAGVIDSPFHEDHVRLLPGVCEAIRTFRDLGYQVVVISNQPGVAKGRFSRAALDRVTARIEESLREAGAPLDAVYYCLHHPGGSVPELSGDCACRKPKPGLLLQAAEERGINLAESFFVGDSVTDVQAGLAAGCRTVLLGRMRCDLCHHLTDQGVQPDLTVRTLHEVAQHLLEQEGIPDAALHRHR